MSGKTGKILFTLFLLALFVNLVLVDLWYLSEKRKLEESIGQSRTYPFDQTTDGENSERADFDQINQEIAPDLVDLDCNQGCQKLIEEMVTEAISKLPTTKPQSSSIKPLAPTGVSDKTKIIYVPLVTEGNTVSTSWSDILPSEFYFDLADYPGTKEVRFYAYLKSDQGAAKVFARLYDQTNNRGVDHSDIETQSGNYTLVESSKMTIWRGNNKYTVQLKSLNGTQAFLKEAKIKIIF